MTKTLLFLPSKSFVSKCFLLPVLVCLAACSSQETSSPSETPVSEAPEKASSSQKKTILFFGNSLTAGYGLDPSEAYPALIQEKIDSLGLNYQVVNAGLSGETTAAGAERVDWILKQEIDIFVLELGGNDGLRGIATTETEKNLQKIIDKVRAKYSEVKILLTGIEVPPNMGEAYANDFRQVFKKIAAQNKVVFLPFLLEGVGGEPELNQPDGIHPTAEGQKIVAENVWEKLKPMLPPQG